jgi:hypothetical protein
MTLDQDERMFTEALGRDASPVPDPAPLLARALRQGTRLRRRRQAGSAVAALAVVGVGTATALTANGYRHTETQPPVAASSTASTGSGASTSSTPPATGPDPQPSPTSGTLDLSDAYAVLDAAGWSALDSNHLANDRLDYVRSGSGASAYLSWRPDPDLGSKYTIEQEQADLASRYADGTQLGTTTIDGDPGRIYPFEGGFVVLGPVTQGRFLSLTTAGLTLEEVVELAPDVHRQAPAHHAFDQQ